MGKRLQGSLHRQRTAWRTVLRGRAPSVAGWRRRCCPHPKTWMQPAAASVTHALLSSTPPAFLFAGDGSGFPPPFPAGACHLRPHQRGRPDPPPLIRILSVRNWTKRGRRASCFSSSSAISSAGGAGTPSDPGGALPPLGENRGKGSHFLDEGGGRRVRHLFGEGNWNDRRGTASCARGTGKIIAPGNEPEQSCIPCTILIGFRDNGGKRLSHRRGTISSTPHHMAPGRILCNPRCGASAPSGRIWMLC